MATNIKRVESASLQKSDLLDTWKEISAYLKRDVRTCQRWEKTHGLPIQRVGRSIRARVFAFRPEINLWLEHNAASHDDTLEVKKRRLWLAAGAPAAILVCTACILVGLSSPKIARHTVHSLTTEHGRIILLDENQNALGEYDTGIKNLMAPSPYLDESRISGKENPNRYDVSMVLDDLENDGKTDTLLVLRTNPETIYNTFIRLTDRAEKLWEYKVGDSPKFGDKVFSDDFQIRDMAVADLTGDGVKEIIVASSHKVSFPSQILVLSASGEKLSEFWHAGRIDSLQVCDFDGDRRQEIVFSGLNAQWKAPCLAVLNGQATHRDSLQTDAAFQYLGDHLKEELYILLPVIGALRESGFSRIRNYLSIEETEDGPVYKVRNALITSFAPDFSLKHMTIAPRASAELMWLNELGSLDKTPRQVLDDLRSSVFRVWRNDIWAQTGDIDKNIQRASPSGAKKPH